MLLTAEMHALGSADVTAHPAEGIVIKSVLETGDVWPLGSLPVTLTVYCSSQIKPKATHSQRSYLCRHIAFVQCTVRPGAVGRCTSFLDDAAKRPF